MVSLSAICLPNNAVLKLVGLDDAARHQDSRLHEVDSRIDRREVMDPADGVVCEPVAAQSEEDAYSVAFGVGLEGGDAWDARWSAEYRRAWMSGLFRGWMVRAERVGREFGLGGRSDVAAHQAIRPTASPFPKEVSRACQTAWERADKDRRAQDAVLLAWAAEQEDLANAREMNCHSLPGWDYAELVEAGGDLARAGSFYI